MAKKVRTKSGRVSYEVGDPIDVCVGAMVRKLRIERRISQADLGSCIGVSLQQVQKYEKGQNRMGASTLYRVAERLEASVPDLFTLVDDGRALKDGDRFKIVLIERLGANKRVNASDHELAEALSDFAAICDGESRSLIRKLLNRLRILSDRADKDAR